MVLLSPISLSHPSCHLAIATGSPDGAYYKFSKAYSAILQEYGITLEVIRTAGSMKNLQLLSADDGGVDGAVLQGGIRSLDLTDDIISPGSLFYEPLWVFQVLPKFLIKHPFLLDFF